MESEAGGKARVLTEENDYPAIRLALTAAAQFCASSEASTSLVWSLSSASAYKVLGSHRYRQFSRAASLALKHSIGGRVFDPVLFHESRHHCACHIKGRRAIVATPKPCCQLTVPYPNRQAVCRTSSAVDRKIVTWWFVFLLVATYILVSAGLVVHCFG
ncbi:hypothetical protein IWX50DRAFT_486258 [Phyllosticta citricarpa]